LKVNFIGKHAELKSVKNQTLFSTYIGKHAELKSVKNQTLFSTYKEKDMMR
jgi:hypothetical protein